MPRLLIIEDDPRIIEAIERSLGLLPGFSMESSREPEAGLRLALRSRPDLILLDIRLPGGDGRNILKRLKDNAATRDIPVIMVTGMSAEGDKVLGLNLGADDYVVKPFGAMELVARIQAVLRRYAPQTGGQTVDARGLEMDLQNRSARLHGRALRLQPREFQILFLLASQPGRVRGRAYLIENSSSYGLPVATRSLDTHIKNLRRKLGDRGARLIETVPKLGYRFGPAP